MTTLLQGAEIGRCATGITQRLGDPVHELEGEAIGESISSDARV